MSKEQSNNEGEPLSLFGMRIIVSGSVESDEVRIVPSGDDVLRKYIDAAIEAAGKDQDDEE